MTHAGETTMARYFGKDRESYQEKILGSARKNQISDSVALIDFLILSNKPTSEEILKQLKPDYYIKGKEYEVKEKDYTGRIYNEERATKKSGGKTYYQDFLKNFRASHDSDFIFFWNNRNIRRFRY